MKPWVTHTTVSGQLPPPRYFIAIYFQQLYIYIFHHSSNSNSMYINTSMSNFYFIAHFFGCWGLSNHDKLTKHICSFYVQYSKFINTLIQLLTEYIVLWLYRYRHYHTDQHHTGTDNYRYSNRQWFRVYWLYWGDKLIYIQGR